MERTAVDMEKEPVGVALRISIAKNAACAKSGLGVYKAITRRLAESDTKQLAPYGNHVKMRKCLWDLGNSDDGKTTRKEIGGA